MSDSDDDKPLGARVAPAKAKPATKRPALPDSSSEDDVPIGARAKAKRPGPQKPKKGTANGHASKGGTLRASRPSGSSGAKSARKPASRKENDAALADKVKKEKKVYDMPGQTRETPDETDPLRKFYTSLYDQRPDSQMARKWLLQVGLLSEDEAQKVLEDLMKQKISGLRSPAKANGSMRRDNDRRPAGKPEPKVAARSAPPAKKGKKRKDESEEEISSSDEEVLPTKKKRRASNLSDDDDDDDGDFKPAKAKPKAKPPPAKKPAKSGKKDVAFTDGGLSDSSDDDKPLGMRIKS